MASEFTQMTDLMSAYDEPAPRMIKPALTEILKSGTMGGLIQISNCIMLDTIFIDSLSDCHNNDLLNTYLSYTYILNFIKYLKVLHFQ